MVQTGLLNALERLPPDPLLGLMAAFREDPRQEKYDLGVGVYKDDAGNTPIMKAVRAAEDVLIKNASTKTYESPRGNLGFCDSIEKLIFEDRHSEVSDRLTSVSTPGGCGALYLAMALSKRISPDTKVWISDPSWPNHAKVAQSLELDVGYYHYLNEAQTRIDFERILVDLSHAKSGDLIVLQGPCHNPTGIDLDMSEWKQLADMAESRGLFLLIDVAYHGLGQGLSDDMLGIRSCLNTCQQALISYSCSKNFGLYRERAGCLMALNPTPYAADATLSHLADISRAIYSMPPAHGQAIVDVILNNEALAENWRAELAEMRQRLKTLRSDFLLPFLGSGEENTGFDGRNGMFLQLKLRPEAVKELRESHAIYIPGSGRINIAGLSSMNARKLGEIISRHVA
jgi:aspartate aminotransferase/aromatic-amino-acid transaminase